MLERDLQSRERAPSVDVPARFAVFSERGEAWADWLNRLPRLVAGVLDEWELTVDGTSMHGECALVVPVVTNDRVPAVLKVGWPHEEADEEHLALRFWAGNGAARLLRADPQRSALLLERLETTDLTSIPVETACKVIADLYPRLHVAASPQFRTLSSLCTRWSDGMLALPRSSGLPRRYVERAAALLRNLSTDPQTDGTIIHTDLHFENVLRGERQRWLAIDPKPLSGDPAFEVAPLLWNRWEEVLDTGDVRRAVRRRLETVVDAAALDEERAKAWVIARMMVNALWEIEDPSPDSDEKDGWLTDCVTISKAMDD